MATSINIHNVACVNIGPALDDKNARTGETYQTMDIDAIDEKGHHFCITLFSIHGERFTKTRKKNFN